MTHFTDKIIIIDQKIKLPFLLFQKKRYIFFAKVIAIWQFTKKYSYNLFHVNTLPL